MSKKTSPKKKAAATPAVPQSRFRRLMRGPLFWIIVAIIAVSIFGQISSAGNRYESIKTSQALDAIAKSDVESAILVDNYRRFASYSSQES